MSQLSLKRADELIEQSYPLLEVVGKYTKLSSVPGAGELKGSCPMPNHDDSSPSFGVNPSKNMFFCFGCGAGGKGTVKFLSLLEERPINQIREELLREMGHSLAAQSPYLEYLDQKAREFETLLYDQRNAHVLDYAVQQRGLTPKTLIEYGVGYCPPGNIPRLAERDKGRRDWQNLDPNSQAHKAGKTGLYSLSGNCLLSGRLVIPVRDINGSVVSFLGRKIPPPNPEAVPPNANQSPKYLNGGENNWFRKNETLFGLYEAKESILRNKQVLIVEGALDVLSLHQAGMTNTVASMGTAISAANLKKLWSLKQNIEIVLVLDGDKPGQIAAGKAVNQAIGVMNDGDQLRICHLPEGLDPDEYVRKNGAQAMMDLITESKRLSEYLLDGLKETHDLTTVEGQAGFRAEAEALQGRFANAPIFGRQLRLTAIGHAAMDSIANSVFGALELIRNNPKFDTPEKDGKPALSSEKFLDDYLVPLLEKSGLLSLDSGSAHAFVQFGQAIQAACERKEGISAAQAHAAYAEFYQKADSKKTVSQIPNPSRNAMSFMDRPERNKTPNSSDNSSNPVQLQQPPQSAYRVQPERTQQQQKRVVFQGSPVHKNQPQIGLPTGGDRIGRKDRFQP